MRGGGGGDQRGAGAVRAGVPPGSRIPSESWAPRSSFHRLHGVITGCCSRLWSRTLTSSSETRASWRGCFQDSPVTSRPFQQHVLQGQAFSHQELRAVALSCPQSPTKEDSAGASGLPRWPPGTRLGFWQAMRIAPRLAVVLPRPEPGGSCRRWRRVSYSAVEMAQGSRPISRCL